MYSKTFEWSSFCEATPVVRPFLCRSYGIQEYIRSPHYMTTKMEKIGHFSLTSSPSLYLNNTDLHRPQQWRIRGRCRRANSFILQTFSPKVPTLEVSTLPLQREILDPQLGLCEISDEEGVHKRQTLNSVENTCIYYIPMDLKWHK